MSLVLIINETAEAARPITGTCMIVWVFTAVLLSICFHLNLLPGMESRRGDNGPFLKEQDAGKYKLTRAPPATPVLYKFIINNF